MPVRRALRVVRRYWRVLARHLMRYTAPVRRAWRRSLQLRVVAITLVASSLLVGTFGGYIADRSAEILLSRAQDEASASLDNKVGYALKQLTLYPEARDPELPSALNDLVNELFDGDSAGRGDSVISIRAERYPDLQAVAVPNVDTRDLITPEMISAVSGDQGGVRSQIRTADFAGRTTKYLVYGSPVPTKFGQVELYYLVPLTSEDQDANMVALTCKEPGCQSSRTGIRLHELDFLWEE